MNKLLSKKRIIILFTVIVLIVGGGFLYQKYAVVKLKVETVDQVASGYSKGCEGVSLYMALKYKEYLDNTSLDQFMSTIPRDENNPYLGFVGDLNTKTEGKRQTIYPVPLTLWGRKYGKVINISGASTDDLKSYLSDDNPVIIYVTFNFKNAKWKTYDFGTVVTNGHVIVLSGYNKITGSYLVNDCYKGRGEYWVKKSVFEKIYNLRKYAVVVE